MIMKIWRVCVNPVMTVLSSLRSAPLMTVKVLVMMAGLFMSITYSIGAFLKTLWNDGWRWLDYVEETTVLYGLVLAFGTFVLIVVYVASGHVSEARQQAFDEIEMNIKLHHEIQSEWRRSLAMRDFVITNQENYIKYLVDKKRK